MKTKIIFQSLLLVLLPTVILAESPEERGLAIATEADRRDTGFGDYTSEVKMILKNKHGRVVTVDIRLRFFTHGHVEEIQRPHIGAESANLRRRRGNDLNRSGAAVRIGERLPVTPSARRF